MSLGRLESSVCRPISPLAAVAPGVAGRRVPEIGLPVRIRGTELVVSAAAHNSFLLKVVIVVERIGTATMGRILMGFLSVPFGPVVHCPPARPHELRGVRVRLVESLLRLELLVTAGVKYDPAAIPLDLIHQRLLVDVYPAQIRLHDLANVHER